VGSPFGDNRLEDYIDPEAIREMMGASDTGVVNIYNYEDNSDVQIFLMHYPIAKMELDLTEYVKNAIADNEEDGFSYVIPDGLASFIPPGGLYLTGKDGPQQEERDPLFVISLADMAKLVEIVEGGPFGVELNYSKSFHDNIRVKIPAFGIDNYQQGEVVGSKLRFYNPAKTEFIPEEDLDNGQINIYVQLIGTCSGIIAFDVLFEWEKATINTLDDNGNNKLEGKYEINDSLGDFLGKGVTFKRIEGYIYVNGVDDNATMILKTLDNELVSSRLSPRSPPTFPASKDESVTTELPQHSLDQNCIDLTQMFENVSQTVLEYQIKVPSMDIYNNDENNARVISVDLVLLLPLEFKVSTPSSYVNEYVKLDLGDIFPEPKDSDLFGRTGDDDLFEAIERVGVYLKDFKNNIFDSDVMAILLAADDRNNPLKNYRELLHFGDEEPSLELFYEDLPNPFIPRFEILFKKDDGANYGTLAIKRKTPGVAVVFDFFLTIEAQVDINIKIDL
jgi:hypothetical protein